MVEVTTREVDEEKIDPRFQEEPAPYQEYGSESVQARIDDAVQRFEEKREHRPSLFNIITHYISSARKTKTPKDLAKDEHSIISHLLRKNYPEIEDLDLLERGLRKKYLDESSDYQKEYEQLYQKEEAFKGQGVYKPFVTRRAELETIQDMVDALDEIRKLELEKISESKRREVEARRRAEFEETLTQITAEAKERAKPAIERFHTERVETPEENGHVGMTYETYAKGIAISARSLIQLRQGGSFLDQEQKRGLARAVENFKQRLNENFSGMEQRVIAEYLQDKLQNASEELKELRLKGIRFELSEEETERIEILEGEMKLLASALKLLRDPQGFISETFSS